MVTYSADLTAGSLKIRESRIIADLLLQEADDEAWHKAIYDDNLLQTRNSATARRLTRLIRKRLERMGPDLWRLIRDGSGTLATHSVLAAAVKQSHLLGDFLDTVVRDQFRLFSETLPRTLFDAYLHECRGRDPEMPEFTQATCRKLQTSVYHILVQAGFLSDTRKLKLQPVQIAEEVVRLLEDNNEDHVLRCIQVSP